MLKKHGVFLFLALTCFSAEVFADILQEFNIVNLLRNTEATGGNAGQTSTPVLITFFISGATSPCFTVTLPYQNSIIVRSGIGFPCRSMVSSINFVPLASKTIGTVYSTPSPFIPIAGQFATNISINQKSPAQGSYGPVFDMTNGMVQTPGTVELGV